MHACASRDGRYHPPLLVGGVSGGMGMGDGSYAAIPSSRGPVVNRVSGRGGVESGGLLYSSYNGSSSLRASDDRFGAGSGVMDDGDDADDDDLAMLRSANVGLPVVRTLLNIFFPYLSLPMWLLCAFAELDFCGEICYRKQCSGKRLFFGKKITHVPNCDLLLCLFIIKLINYSTLPLLRSFSSR